MKSPVMIFDVWNLKEWDKTSKSINVFIFATYLTYRSDRESMVAPGNYIFNEFSNKNKPLTRQYSYITMHDDCLRLLPTAPVFQ